jgi:hypothetical protein
MVNRPQKRRPNKQAGRGKRSFVHNVHSETEMSSQLFGRNEISARNLSKRSFVTSSQLVRKLFYP